MSDRTNYSPMEEKILGALRGLGTGKRLSTPELSTRVYQHGIAPLNPGQSIIVTMNSLMRKVDRNLEKFVVRKSARTPPKPLEFWIEQRKQ